MKKKALLIAEKPSLMRDIKAVYEANKDKMPYEIEFVAQAGHLLELLKPNEMTVPEREGRAETIELIEPEMMGGWQYKVSDDKRELYDKIKKLIKSNQFDVIIHAGDPDQEGQLLVDLVLKRIGASKYCEKILRFWSNDTTEVAILDTLLNLKDNSDKFFVDLSNAALLRQWTDYRFGMNGSSAARKKLRAVYPSKKIHSSVGRVKTVVLKMVFDRIKEINNFVPSTTYGIKANYSSNFSGTLFVPKDSQENLDATPDETQDESSIGTVFFDTEAEALNFINNMSLNGIVSNVETKKATTSAPAVHTLSTLQIEASEKFHYSPDETLSILQTLYQNGHVSYPRTDCALLSSNLDFNALLVTAARIPDLKPFYNNLNVNEAISNVKKQKKYVNDKEMAKHGHTGLCPTTRHPNLNLLTADEYNIYNLVCKRFFAIFLPPLIQNKTTIVVEVKDNSGKTHLFKSNGKVLVSAGFTELTGLTSNDVILPSVNKGDSLNINNFELNKKTTTCPKPYTTGTIIQAMENPTKYFENEELKKTHKDMVIGRSSTRSKILKDLLEKDLYLEVKTSKKTEYLYPTKLGCLILGVVDKFDICKVDMTAVWEDLINQVRLGEIDFDPANQHMRKSAAKLFSDISCSQYTPLDDVSFLPDSGSSSYVACQCPCGGQILDIKDKQFFCSNYKEGCKNSSRRVFLGAKISRSDIKHLIEEKKVIKKQVSNKDGSKTWEQKIYYNFDEHKIDFYKKS